MEFLIKRIDCDFVDLPERDPPCAVFQPAGFATEIQAGLEVCAIRFEGALLTFSMEMPGVQVVVESGSVSGARVAELLGAIAHELSASTGQELEVVRYA